MSRDIERVLVSTNIAFSIPRYTWLLCNIYRTSKYTSSVSFRYHYLVRSAGQVLWVIRMPPAMGDGSAASITRALRHSICMRFGAKKLE